VSARLWYWWMKRKNISYSAFLLQFHWRICKFRRPLWPSGQGSWLQILKFRFNSRRYQIFWEVVGPEQGALSLVSTVEELLDRKSRGYDVERREYCRWDPSRRPRGTLYPQKLTLTSPTSGGRSVGIVRSRTQTTEFLINMYNCIFVKLYQLHSAVSYTISRLLILGIVKVKFLCT
jgi:hypothetical protein